MMVPLNPALVKVPMYDAGPCESISTLTRWVTPGGSSEA